MLFNKDFEEAFKKKTMRYQENISREKLKQMLFETKNFDVYNIQSYLIQYIFSICEVFFYLKIWSLKKIVQTRKFRI